MEENLMCALLTANLSLTVFLAIDDVSLPFRKNVGLYLSKPVVRREPVLAPSPFGSAAPDNSAAHFYGTVLHDNGKFRMWYYAAHWGKNPDWPPQMMRQVAKSPGWFHGECPLFQGPICYAESDDGIAWTKPALGQVLFKGSRANNALALPHAVVGSAGVIKDETEPDPSRRYKMVYEFFPDQSEPPIAEYGTKPSVALAVSPDGLRWTVIGIPFRSQFVEPSSFIKHEGQYVIHYQVMDKWAGYLAEGGTPCGRTGVARVSSDFEHWPDVLAEAFALAEPEDRSKRGQSGSYDQVHLGVGAASFGNVCVGLYGLWHNADFSKAFDSISCDFGLLVSNDGVHFREPVKGHRFLRREESPVTPVPGHAFNTVLCQANGILNVGDETRIYHGRWRNVGGNQLNDVLKYYSGEVALATLPRDRWGALGLNPDATAGEVWSSVVTLPPAGCEIVLNADGARGMRVEIADERLHPIAGFSGPASGKPDVEGGLDCLVKWPGANLSALGGRRVRLGVHLQASGPNAPRLYAVYLRPGQETARMTTVSGTAYAMLPPHDGAPAPTLLLLAMAGTDTLATEPYCRVGRLLYGQGWNVVSLDLPCHGDDRRAGEPEQLAGWAARTAAGEDVAAAFRQRVNDVVADLVARKMADPARLAAAGTSRGGFMAFQAAAGNPLIRAVAGFAPVTDLLALSEFSSLKDPALAGQLALTNVAGKLAERAVWITIGDHDGRVGTDRAAAFANALRQAAEQQNLKARVTLNVVPVPGHTSLPAWHEQAADWLKQAVVVQGK
ncbi:MAG: prolyl oligopeptidase family serine peptidase [bacterium]